jgi:hypothetical protein
MGAPMAVIAHRAPTVARPVRLTRGLPADEVDEEGVTEVWAICWATKEATELTVSAGRCSGSGDGGAVTFLTGSQLWWSLGGPGNP